MKLRFLIAAVFLLAAFGADAQDRHQTIRTAVENRDYAAATAGLRALRESDRRNFELNNYDYLLARLYEKTGDYSSAAAGYQSVVSRGSVLREYAAWRLASIARASGNLLLERTLLFEISARTPDSLLSDAVAYRLTRNLFESRNYAEAIARLAGASGGVAEKPNPAAVARERENLVLLGEAYLRSGRTAEAREVFTRLVNNLPNPAQPDDFALSGARGLDRIDAGADFGKTAPQLPDHLHLQRAIVYQFNRDFHDARLHYSAIVDRYPDSGNVPDALFRIGRGYAQEGEYEKAIEWYDRVISKFPDHPSAKDALNQSASALARTGRFEQAVARYKRFIGRYAGEEGDERAFLNIVDTLRDAGDDKGALEWAARTQEAFRGKLPEATALFSQLRIRISRNEWTEALADADRLLGMPDLGGTRIPGGTTKSEIGFLRALILEKSGRFGEAVEAYLAIPDGRSEYYGWRTTERLRAMAAAPESRDAVAARLAQLRLAADQPLNAANADRIRQAAQSAFRISGEAALLKKIADAYALLPAYGPVPAFKALEVGRREPLSSRRPAPANRHRAIADELIFLGLFDEAAAELEESVKDEVKTDDLRFTIADLYRHGDIAHRAVGFVEPLWRQVPSDFQIELMPDTQAAMLYPAPYRDALEKYGPPRGVDPLFLLSIMRQESRFRADVKSVAAARGLMQFISTTANQIALELGRRDFRQDELYDPPTAILFGAQYLSNIFRIFPEQHAAVAAGYNGGEENVKRWIARSKSDDPDRYVAEFVFAQSKDYAWKVMANYRVYRAVKGG